MVVVLGSVEVQEGLWGWADYRFDGMLLPSVLGGACTPYGLGYGRDHNYRLRVVYCPALDASADRTEPGYDSAFGCARDRPFSIRFCTCGGNTVGRCYPLFVNTPCDRKEYSDVSRGGWQ
jgi:hypothetical protein